MANPKTGTFIEVEFSSHGIAFSTTARLTIEGAILTRGYKNITMDELNETLEDFYFAAMDALQRGGYYQENVLGATLRCLLIYEEYSPIDKVKRGR